MTRDQLLDRLNTIVCTATEWREPLEDVVNQVRKAVLTPDELSLLEKKSRGPDVLAAGPVFGGEMTRPYRFVVLRWDNGEFSCHTQYLDGDIGFDNGHYFGNTGADGFLRAVRKWKEKVDTELERRPSCLLHEFKPEGR